ncbi:MAG: cytochrome-c oxidase, cbb3-type subunit II [Pseudomonadota bacterium]
MGLHKKLEENTGLLIFGILLVSAMGGLVQVLPILYQESLETPTENTEVYSPVELTGRDIYIRDGCHVCHTQQVRPLIAEVERYGAYSRSGEFVYDRPFLWGSKRTGPDLHRLGGKYSDIWHREHLIDPRSVVPDSIMPAYPWLVGAPASEVGDIQKKMQVLQRLGHPYSDEDIENAPEALEGVTEMDALIVYLQQLGTSMPQGEVP